MAKRLRKQAAVQPVIVIFWSGFGQTRLGFCVDGIGSGIDLREKGNVCGGSVVQIVYCTFRALLGKGL